MRAQLNQNVMRQLGTDFLPYGNKCVGRTMDSLEQVNSAVKPHDRTSSSEHDFSQIPVELRSVRRIQPKLTINQPGDQFEQEADRVADLVMRMPEPGLQRKCSSCGAAKESLECPECKKKRDAEGTLQRRSTSDANAGMAAPPIVNDVLSSPGSPLPKASRDFMESRFGQDFSQVRIHNDSLANRSAQAVSARAYTVGNTIVFGEGNFSPHTLDGGKLLAHELSHVVQQRNSSPQQKVLQREAVLKSSMSMCRRYLEGESRFQVTKGGIVVTVNATPMRKDTKDATPCNAPPMSVTLNKDRLGPDAEYGSCGFEYGSESSRSWANLPEGTYYLSFWTADRENEDCCIEGSVEVNQFEGMTGSSCTEAPPGPMDIIHGALDIAGVIPALGVIPDGINAGLYSIEGDWANAGVSAVAMIPFLGDAAMIGKGIKKAGAAVKLTSKGTEKLGQVGIEVALKEAKAAEKTLGKDAVREGTETFAKEAEKGLGKASRLIGKSGREAFGEVRFMGLVQNRPLRDLTHNEIYQAFRDTPYVLSNHAVKRLKDIRTKNLGLITLNDIANHLNKGIISDAAKGAISIQNGGFEAIINPVTKVIITFTP